MSYVLIRHKVKDYASWKPVFDEHGSARQAAGSKGGRLFRSADDPNEVIAILEWDDLQKARDFVASPDLRQAMEQAGVADQPDIYFLEGADQPAK